MVALNSNIERHMCIRLVFSLTFLLLYLLLSDVVVYGFKSHYSNYSRRIEAYLNYDGGSNNRTALTISEERKVEQSLSNGDVSYINESTLPIRSNSSTLSAKVAMTGYKQYMFDSLIMVRGSFLTRNACMEGRNVAVLGSKTAQELFSSYDVVGNSIQIAGKTYKIIGVYKSSKSFLPGFISDDERVYVPLESCDGYEKIPIETLLISDRTLAADKFRIEKVKSIFSDNCRVPDNIYSIKDYCTDGMLLQQKHVFIFLIGLLCIVLLLKYSTACIKHFLGVLKESMNDRYLNEMLKYEWKLIIKIFVIFVLTLGGSTALFMLVKFNLYIPPGHNADGNVFKLLLSILKEAVGSQNMMYGHAVMQFERYNDFAFIVSSIFTSLSIITFVLMLWDYRLYKMINWTDSQLIKYILLSAALTSVLMAPVWLLFGAQLMPILRDYIITGSFAILFLINRNKGNSPQGVSLAYM